ncbi:MAG: adenosylcobinamide-phosphate synthase CbiB [Rhodospirillales bacterium]
MAPNVVAQARADKSERCADLSGSEVTTLTAFLSLALLALLLEALCGYPQALFRRLRHPVVWIGTLIAGLDRRLNREALSPTACRLSGCLALLAILVAVLLPAWLLQSLLLGWVWPLGLALLALLTSSLLAQRSLDSHVRAVAEGLEDGGLAGGRKAVAMIVGRDPESLDEAGVARAAIESLAENFSDGVVAPTLYCALAGLPGIACYKAVNTADSMIGHRTERHGAFGWAAARCDDLLNLPAARLSVLWIAAAALLLPGARPGQALRAAWRDAGRHRSPNAGWPEAAVAGALGLRLAGPRRYGEAAVSDAWMGHGRAEAEAGDIRRALALYRLAALLQAFALLLLLGLISGLG